MRRSAIAAGCLAAVLAAGCRTDPQAAARTHLARGDKQFAANKLPEAIVEYRSAAANDPNSGEAQFKLAEALAKHGDLRDAFRAYVRASDLLPERDDVQLKAGNLLLVVGRFDEARQRARTVLQRNAKSLQATILLGNSLAGLKDLQQAIEVSRRAADLDPERGGVYRNIGVFELARGDADAAEEAFRRAVEIDPKSASAYVALGQFLRGRERFDEAEAVLKRGLAADAGSVVINQALATLFIESRRMSEAEPYLKAAAAASRSTDAWLGLADYYLATRRPDEARRVLEELSKNPEALSLASARLAVVEYVTGNKAKSYQLLDGALAKNPKNVSALAMKARLLLSDDKVEEALATTKTAVDLDARSVDAQLMRGRVQVVRNELEDARKTFKDVLEIDPHNIEAVMQLSRLHLQRREIPTAIDFASKGASGDPDNLEARLLYVNTLLVRNEDFDRAEAELAKLATQFPSAPALYNAYGALALARNDGAGARRAWDTALRLDPTNIEALSGIAAMAAAAQKIQDARALVDGKLAAAPNNPGLLFLSAKISIVAKDDAAAEKTLRRVIELEPSNIQAYTLLGQIFVAGHRTAEAKQEFLAITRRQPTSVPAHTMLGLLCQAERDIDGAMQWYEKAVQINPRAATAANNLAWLYLTRNTKLEAAVQLAQAAKAELPDQPEVLDTLGWAYFKQDQIGAAIPVLASAVQRDPNNAIHHFHLGMALAKNGEDARARRSLQQALKLKPDFDGASLARTTIDSLVY